ncbi:MAG TPA: PIG-L deacetylase family protein [Chloroflexota bacterium]|nr:PIG-L deacetylase family protein [Chloroflexota bacterium]
MIIAHADDAEFGSAGTIARWVKQGVEVTYVVVTNGNKGSADPEMTPEALAALREKEQRAACKVLGVKNVVFLGYQDGELVPSLELRRNLTREVRRYKPDVAMVPDPTTWYFGNTYINHPDHRAVGEAALAAIFPSARDRLTFPELLVEGFEPHMVREVYLSFSMNADTWVDITDTMDTKLAALREHRSQLPDMDEIDKNVRERAIAMAEGREMKYAEAYKKMVLR